MKMGYLLGGTIAVAMVLGFYLDRSSARTQPTRESARSTATAAAPESPAEDGATLSGTVIETIDVPEYTYLHLDTGAGERWAAVPLAKIAKGERVTVVGATQMNGFRSPTLDRTFDVIYFGNLGDGVASAGAGALPPGHPPTSVAPGRGGEPAGHPAATPTGDEVALPKVDKASGANAERIGDAYASLSRLAGKKLRVRGVVVKVTPGINGKTFLHLRDGSGDAASRTNDLAATTQAEPKQGEVVTLEGVLRADVDIGIGYHYPALLEDAIIVEN